MKKKYQPEKQENKIYQQWEKTKAFSPRRDKRKNPFSIVMPPPNANAPLHIGHAMFVTLEDIMARFQRMKGSSSLLLPGADHAGILTQVVFERKLAEQGKTRFDLGRKKFYQQCLKFSQKNKKIMYQQIRKIGASCDWTREKFTLNKKINLQVLKTFVKLYQDGLAYRGKRLINWCPRCMTALSDLEIEHKEIKTKLWYIKYPLLSRSKITGQKRFLVVATTRPETMLGDRAVAVNPKDKRYQKFIGQKVILPLVGRKMPVIADKEVDPEFGTGVVKVTPAHDPVDFKIAKKHKLAIKTIINFDLKMTEKAGQDFAGLSIKEAREKITKLLKSKEYLIKEKNFSHSVGHCERCQTMIEPLISKQWFIKVNKRAKIKNKKLQKTLGRKTASLSELGSLAVKKKLIKILPARFKKNYFNWMNKLHDWCISRQIWWGHRLPIWYCGLSGLSKLQKQMNKDMVKKIKNKKIPLSDKKGCGQTIIALKKPGQCPHCGNKNLINDPDTFDTWFSSAQWPYTSLGYPQGKDYQYFYPTSVMETGYEILFFWVARMIMLGLYRTGKTPFKTVYLHGLVRDAFGEKMSKSKGNAIEPIEIIEKYGADALRMALVVGSSPGNDISIGKSKIKGYRNFANKVWNIGRFVDYCLKSTRKKIPWYRKNLQTGLTKEDKKIVKKLNKLIQQTTELLENYQFSHAGEKLYHFIWDEFANKYLEYSKKRVKEKDVIVISILRHVYLTCLKLLHPFMPFITEAVWQQIPSRYLLEKQLITASWPEAE